MNKLTLTMLMLSGAAASLSAPALAQDPAPAPSYNWAAGGYLWVNSDDDAISDLNGFALAGSYEIAPRIVLQAAYENARSKVDPDLADVKLTGGAYVATIGTYLPLSPRVHLTLDAGIDYETLEAKGTDVGGGRQTLNQTFANIVFGIKAKPSRRLEIGASLQRLEGLEKGDDSGWVGRADVFYAISNRFDVGGSVAYEGDEPALLAGGRVRF